MIHHYMMTYGMLEGRPDEAPISANILKRYLDSWCYSCGIPITSELKENHEVDVLTYGESKKMWDHAMGRGWIKILS